MLFTLLKVGHTDFFTNYSYDYILSSIIIFFLKLRKRKKEERKREREEDGI